MSRLFALYSQKGGVGQSFISVNLAANLAKETQGTVLLIDGSSPFSNDIASFLNIKNIRSITQLLPIAETISSTVLFNYPLKYRETFSILSLESEADSGLYFTEEIVTKISSTITLLSDVFDYIIIDVANVPKLLLEKLLDCVQRIIVPLEPTPLSLMAASATLNYLKQLNFPNNIFLPLLNKYSKKTAVTHSMAEQRLGVKIPTAIPFESKFDDYFTAGKIHTIDLLDSQISSSFSQISLHLLQSTAYQSVNVNQPDLGVQEELSYDDKVTIKLDIHTELIDIIDLKQLDISNIDSDPIRYKELQDHIKKIAIEILDTKTTIQSRDIREQIIKEVIQETLGLGMLEDLLADPDVSEIMVNSWQQIFYEQNGKLKIADRKFLSEKQLLTIIDRIITPLGRRIDTSSPMVDGRLKDGSRVNAIIPPLALDGAAVTIRKFGGDSVGLDELIKYGTLNSQVGDFLQAAVKCRLNVIVSGGTGSGKTTLLNILSSFIPDDERILTIEDSAELQLRQPHVVRLESRPANIEGAGEISIRDLVKNALRMRPDRIVIGECRSGEALDMLQAMNTGHDGSLTTLHANSPRESLSRLETLVLFAGFDLPVKAIREQIAGAVHIIVQLSRLKDGTRKIMKVSEVTGIIDDNIQLEDIYQFNQTGQDEKGIIEGNFVSTGYAPVCLKTFEEFGLTMAKELFWKTI